MKGKNRTLNYIASKLQEAYQSQVLIDGDNGSWPPFDTLDDKKKRGGRAMALWVINNFLAYDDSNLESVLSEAYKEVQKSLPNHILAIKLSLDSALKENKDDKVKKYIEDARHLVINPYTEYEEKCGDDEKDGRKWAKKCLAQIRDLKTTREEMPYFWGGD